MVLVWFHERGEGTSAGAEHVANQVRLPVPSVEPALSELVRRDLLAASKTVTSEFQYVPDPARREAIAHLAREYRENPVLVMKLLTENAIERVRTAALKTFAECFRIRGPR